MGEQIRNEVIVDIKATGDGVETIEKIPKKVETKININDDNVQKLINGLENLSIRLNNVTIDSKELAKSISSAIKDSLKDISDLLTGKNGKFITVNFNPDQIVDAYNSAVGKINPKNTKPLMAKVEVGVENAEGKVKEITTKAVKETQKRAAKNATPPKPSSKPTSTTKTEVSPEKPEDVTVKKTKLRRVDKSVLGVRRHDKTPVFLGEESKSKLEHNREALSSINDYGLALKSGNVGYINSTYDEFVRQLDKAKIDVEWKEPTEGYIFKDKINKRNREVEHSSDFIKSLREVPFDRKLVEATNNLRDEMNKDFNNGNIVKALEKAQKVFIDAGYAFDFDSYIKRYKGEFNTDKLPTVSPINENISKLIANKAYENKEYHNNRKETIVSESKVNEAIESFMRPYYLLAKDMKDSEGKSRKISAKDVGSGKIDLSSLKKISRGVKSSDIYNLLDTFKLNLSEDFDKELAGKELSKLIYDKLGNGYVVGNKSLSEYIGKFEGNTIAQKSSQIEQEMETIARQISVLSPDEAQPLLAQFEELKEKRLSKFKTISDRYNEAVDRIAQMEELMGGASFSVYKYADTLYQQSKKAIKDKDINKLGNITVELGKLYTDNLDDEVKSKYIRDTINKIANPLENKTMTSDIGSTSFEGFSLERPLLSRNPTIKAKQLVNNFKEDIELGLSPSVEEFKEQYDANRKKVAEKQKRELKNGKTKGLTSTSKSITATDIEKNAILREFEKSQTTDYNSLDTIKRNVVKNHISESDIEKIRELKESDKPSEKAYAEGLINSYAKLQEYFPQEDYDLGVDLAEVSDKNIEALYKKLIEVTNLKVLKPDVRHQSIVKLTDAIDDITHKLSQKDIDDNKLVEEIAPYSKEKNSEKNRNIPPDRVNVLGDAIGKNIAKPPLNIGKTQPENKKAKKTTNLVLEKIKTITGKELGDMSDDDLKKLIEETSKIKSKSKAYLSGAKLIVGEGIRRYGQKTDTVQSEKKKNNTTISNEEKKVREEILELNKQYLDGTKKASTDKEKLNIHKTYREKYDKLQSNLLSIINNRLKLGEMPYDELKPKATIASANIVAGTATPEDRAIMAEFDKRRSEKGGMKYFMGIDLSHQTPQPTATPTQVPTTQGQTTTTQTQATPPTPTQTPTQVPTQAPIQTTSKTTSKPTTNERNINKYVAMVGEIERLFGATSDLAKKARIYLATIQQFGVGAGGGDELNNIFKKYVIPKLIEKAGISIKEEDEETQRPPWYKRAGAFGVGILGGMLQGGVSKFFGLLQGLVNKLKGLVTNLIKKTISSAVNPFKKSVKMFTGAIRTAGGKSKALSSLSELLIMPLVLAVEFTLLPVLKKLIPSIKETIDWVVKSKSKFTLLGEAIAVVANKVYAMLTGNFVLGFEKFFNTLTKYGSEIDSAYNNSETLFGNLNKAGVSLKNISNNLGTLATVANNLNNELINFGEDNPEYGSIVTTFADSVGNALFESITTSTESIWNAFDNVLNNDEAYSHLQSFFNGLIKSLGENIETTSKIGAEFIDQLMSGINNYLSTEKGKETLTNISRNIADIISQVMSSFSQNVIPTVIQSGAVGELAGATWPIWLSSLGLSALGSGAGSLVGSGIKGIKNKILTGSTTGGIATNLGKSKKNAQKTAAKNEPNMKNYKSQQKARNKANAKTEPNLKNLSKGTKLSSTIGKVASGASLLGGATVAGLAAGGTLIANGISTAITNANVKGTDTVQNYLDSLWGPASWIANLQYGIDIDKIKEASGWTEEFIKNLSIGDFNSALTRIGNNNFTTEFKDTMESIYSEPLSELSNTIENSASNLETTINDNSSVPMNLNITNAITINKDGSLSASKPVTTASGLEMHSLSVINITGA